MHFRKGGPSEEGGDGELGTDRTGEFKGRYAGILRRKLLSQRSPHLGMRNVREGGTKSSEDLAFPEPYPEKTETIKGGDRRVAS